MRYIYGPVNSRRLGVSLGVSLTAHKICNFDCIYCQLGNTQERIQERKEYVKPDEILNELKSWLQENPEESKALDYITLSGLGEPLLNLAIGTIIREIKKINLCPVAVITNASFLGDKRVRAEIEAADLIVPSLDSVIPAIFQKVDRPHQDIKLEQIIGGLVDLRNEFKGKIWLEVMLVAGVNDDLRHIKKLKQVVDRINPDKLQLNSPLRTHDPNVLPVDKSKLKKIKEILGDKAEVV